MFWEMWFAAALPFLYAGSIPIVFLLSPLVNICRYTQPTIYCAASKTMTKVAQDSWEYYITAEMSKMKTIEFTNLQKQLSFPYLRESLETISLHAQKKLM